MGASSEPKVWPRPALRASAMALTAALAILVALAACATALDSDHGKQQHQRPWHNREGGPLQHDPPRMAGLPRRRTAPRSPWG